MDMHLFVKIVDFPVRDCKITKLGFTVNHLLD